MTCIHYFAHSPRIVFFRWFGDKNKGSGDIVTVDKEVVAFAGTQSDYIEWVLLCRSVHLPVNLDWLSAGVSASTSRSSRLAYLKVGF